MKIKEVCRRTGLTEKSVRFYAQHGLCTPSQVEVRGRVYSEYSAENLRELKQVADLRAIGLSIEQICRIKAGEGISEIMEEHKSTLCAELERKQKIYDVIKQTSFEGAEDISSLVTLIKPALGKEVSPPDFSRLEDVSCISAELSDISGEPWYQRGKRLAGAVMLVIIISTMIAVTNSLGIIVFLCSALLFMKKRSGYLLLFRVLAMLGIIVNSVTLRGMIKDAEVSRYSLIADKPEGELVYLIIIAAESIALLLLLLSSSLKEYLRA